MKERTLGIDPQALREHLARVGERSGGGQSNRLTGRKLAAIVPMHALGHPADMPRILEVAAEYALPVVEDAAESLGTMHDDQHTGTFGRIGTLSFNGNKLLTTGGGGMILANEAQLGAPMPNILQRLRKNRTLMNISTTK